MRKHFDFETNPKTDYPKWQYLADFLTDKAVDFIKRHKHRPFFLHLPHFGVHSPHDAKADLTARFKPKPGVGGHNNATYAAMIASVDESVGRVMQTLDELKLAENTVLIFTSDNGGVGGYGDFVVQTDDTVGRVLAALEKHGFAEDTLVIFAADTGPERYAYDRIKNSDHRSMGPLRGLKRDIWEGGYRVPFVVRWLGNIPAGKVSGGLISHD